MRIIELRLGSFCDYLMVVALSKVFEIEKHVGILLNIKYVVKHKSAKLFMTYTVEVRGSSQYKPFNPFKAVII